MIETYSPLSARVKTYQVVSDQAPEFAIAENPLLEGFLQQYYISQEYQGGPVDIAENIDQYIKVDNLTKDVISGNTSLAADINATDDTITVSTNTKGFPNQWGLLKVNDEIITYSGVTTNTFTGCVRGFSGIATYRSANDPTNLTWEDTTAGTHTSGSSVQNLSALFLREFYDKIKAQYTPGLQGVNLSPELDVNNFIKEARSLYESKGTDESFKILFKALFGLEPKINDLEKYLIKPSYANYLRRESFAVRVVSGDPLKLIGQTLYQDAEANNPLVNTASGPISEVVQIRDDYYRLSVFIGYDDKDLIQGTFVVPGKTQVVGNVGLGATVLTVDSTIGFGQTGTFEVGLSSDSYYQKLDYTEKTVNQFIGVTTTYPDIPSASEIYTPTIVYGYEDNDLQKPVNMRITGVLSKFDSIQNLYGLSETSRIKVKNLGRLITNPPSDQSYDQTFFNSWVYNTSARYQIEDLSGSTFTLAGDIDKSSLKVGDKIELLVRNTETVAASSLIVSYVNATNNSISISGTFTTSSGLSYDIRRIQEKAVSTKVPIIGGQNQILADVSNAYVLDSKYSESDKKEAFITSNSLPSYDIQTDKVHAALTNPSISGGSYQGYNTLTDKFTIISFAQNVPFRTGDEIVYVPGSGSTPIGGLTKESYFVEVLSQKNKIKLYQSRSFIPSGISVEFVPPNTPTGFHDFVRVEQARKSIFPARAIKRFVLEQNLQAGKEQKTTSERTLDGNTGMLVNGVELTNYKSDKFIYYGPLKSLDIVNAGTGYDIVYPPSIIIEDSSTGINTAVGRLSIGGTITDVLIDPVEYEIEKVISVDIHGGNGSGAKAQAVTELAYRQFTFNAKSFYSGGNIDPLDGKGGRFIMNKEHFYKTGDRVIYSSNNNNVVGLHTSAAVGIDTCLVEGQSYYVGVTSSTIFKLYRSKTDAVAGVANTVGFGTTAANLNSGIHQFRDYYTKRRISRVTMLDGGSGYTNRRLSIAPAGISTLRDFVEFENHGFSDGEVVHYGISTTGGTAISGLSTNSQYQVLKINDDRFRLCYSGIATTRTPDKTNYLNKEYIRFGNHGTDYQDFFYPPVTIDINVITNADTPQTLEANPIVRGGVVDTILFDKGRDYGSTIINFEKAPSVDINYGQFGQVGLIIVNGRIIDAFVQSRGTNYDGPPDINVIGLGTATGAKLRAVMDGSEILDVKVLSQGAGYASSTTTVSVKAPGDSATFSTRVRRLVGNKYSTSGTSNGDYLAPVEDGLAVESVAYGATVRNYFNDDGSGHSPIVGWSYDGYPIYGPYGLSDIDDIQSSSRRMKTSYKLDANRVTNRPSTSEYEAGFFIEDYYYDASGDLDEHNGRFCKTPDFQEGTYAYFATVDNVLIPEFPYYIGDTYRGFPLKVNTVSGEKIRQTNYSFETSKLVRNTHPYKMFGDGAGYDFVYQPYTKIPNVAYPDRILSGSIDNIKISSPGTGYTVGAKINFDETGTGGNGITAYVNTLVGQDVTKIVTSKQVWNSAVFEWKQDSVIAHIDPYHTLKLKDYVQVAGLSTSVNKLDGSHKVSLVNYSTKLLSDGFVGIVTDIQVQTIPSTIGAGSTIGIGTESAHVLNIFRNDNVLRIRRSIGVQTNTVGVALSYFSNEIEIPLITDKFTSIPTKKVYLNPSESVGFGQTYGQTVERPYQYLGITANRSIPTQSIYVKDHGFQTNDILTIDFGPSGGSNLGVRTDSVTSNAFALPSTVYAVKQTDDTIGLKTTKTSDEVYFTSGGGDFYDWSLTHTPTEQVTGTVERIAASIQTKNNHQLADGDYIDLIVKPGLATGIGTTTYTKLKVIDDYLIANPLTVVAAGINTSTNRISVNSHGLITGDRILYYGTNLPGGITQREYYVVVIDKNTIQLANTLKETQGTPNIVDITSTGSGNWTINPINPQLRPYRNNDLIFDMSDSTLLGYDLKFYYDANYFNEFVGSGTSLGFEVVGVSSYATVGVGSTVPLASNPYHPVVTLKHSETAPKVVWYNLFDAVGMSTADSTVVNGNEVKYVDSSYTGGYNITGIGSTEFSINLRFTPESLQYSNADCELIQYTTQSKSTTGGIATVRISNPGLNYDKIPGITSVTGTGINATLIPESTQINQLADVTVPDDVFGYPSDNTLKPDAFIPRVVDIDSFATIDAVKVTFGGKFYITAPSLVLFDKFTGDIVDSGLITCELSDSAVTSATVSVPPTGLSNNDFGVAPVRNSNGLTIISAESQLGVLTCKISTPVLGYTAEPVSIGDSCFVEGITFDNNGTGYNSGDYKFTPFRVTDYNDATNPREVTFDLNGISTNPGTGATVAFGFGVITQSNFIAQFEVIKGNSKFIQNEPFKRNNNPIADIQLDFINESSAQIIVSGAEPLEINDILVGKLSGSSCRVIGITEFDGNFEIDSSVKTIVGWRDNIGLINDTNQVLPDNDYYQNLSYAIESPKTYEDLITYVNDVVHPSGLKNFANTEVIAKGDPGKTMIPADDAGGLVLDFIGDPLRVDSIYPFDLARDFGAQGNISKFVELRTTRLADFILNKTNRVLNIDDIAPQFVSNESNDLSDYRTVAQYPAGRYFQRWLTQTVHRAEDPRKDHYQINEFISLTIDSNTYLFQKHEQQNYDQVGLTTGYVVFDSTYDPATSNTYLIARPNEPFDTNYEIKTLQQNFADSVGVGSTAFGHVRVEGGLVQAGAASTLGVSNTTNIIGVSTLTTKAALVQFVVIDNPTGVEKRVDYLEYAVMHNGVDTYLTELSAFNSRQNLSGLSAPQFIGTFTSKIESGVLKLDFENGSQNPVNVKSKVIAVDPSVVGPTTNYRFKIPFTPDGTERSARLEVSSQAKAGIATICGIASMRDLTVKSTVHVAYGATQSIHQVYTLTDPYTEENFITEYPLAAIGSTTGVGTFGSTYRPDGHINIEFHPSVSGIVSITAYNEILYRELDPNGTILGIGQINYGQVYESVAQNVYLGINNRDVKSFDLKYQGTPIYARETNINDPSVLNYNTGVFSQKHFFSTYEQLTYLPDSNLVGIGGSALVYYTGVGVATAYLPSTVYGIKDNNQEYRIATSKVNALAGLGVTFVPNSGAGNQHRFSMRKRDSKSMISISGLVQKPISYTSINYELDVPVAGFVTAFVLNGISSITSGDLLKIEDEYSIVRTVGFGTTTVGPVVGIGTWTLVEVERGSVGTAATPHAAGETVRLFRGSFQILDSKIHFTQAPLGGDTGIINPNNLPYARATFGGRTFLRKDYEKNQLFDDLSESFDGLETAYPLTSIGAAVTGIGTTGGNGVLFINNIFQAPYSENNPNANFKIGEQAGISSVIFTGISSIGYTTPIIDTFDVNENQLPRGGIIVSVASTPGRGYAQFKGAVVKPIINVSTGAVDDIVGVPTSGAAIGIKTAFYNNISGIMEVTTVGPHNLKIEDPVKLEGLEFACTGYGNTLGITSFVYDHISGIATIITNAAHGFTDPNLIGIATGSLTFTCGMDSNATNHVYPRVGDPIHDKLLEVRAVTDNTFDVFVGITTNVGYTPTNAIYDANAGIMTMTIPNHNIMAGRSIKIKNSSLDFKCAMDGTSQTKSYPRSTDPVYDTAISVASTTATGIAVTVGTSPIVNFDISTATYTPSTGFLSLDIGSHSLTAGTSIKLKTESLIFRCNTDSYISTHTYPRNTIDTQTVNGATYDANAGIMTVTVVPGGRLIHDGDWIRFDNDSISFKCDMDGGTSTKTYPRSSDPVSGKWLPITGITTTSFSVEVGKSPIQPFSISSAIYDPTAGIVTATIGDHSFMTGQSIQISPESMSFRCGLDTYQSVHNYPRSSDPGFTTAVSIASTSANTISFQVLASQPSTNISTHHFVPHDGLTAETGTQYDGTVGIMTVRSANHGLSNGDWVLFDTGAVSFTCAKDDYSTTHAYPRETDPYSGKWIQVSNVTTNTFRTNGMSSPDTSDHIFASGVTGAIKRSQIHGGGAYGHTFQAAGVGSMDQKRDRAFDQAIGIHSVSGNVITLQVGVSTDTSEHHYDIMAGHEATDAVISGGAYAHTFQSALAGAVQYGGNYPHSFVSSAANPLRIDTWAGTALTPTNAVYNPTSGVLQFTVPNHGLVKPENFKLSGIGVTCVYGAKSYPSGYQGYFYTVREVVNTTKLTTSVGISTVAHQYVSGGELRTGITTNIFPDYDQTLDITGIVSAKTFRVNAGPSTIPHSYHAGGTAAPWYNLTFGSGYTTNLGTVSIGVTDAVGSGANVTAIVGAGGSLIYSINNAGSGYSDNSQIYSPEPSGADLNIIGSYRQGLGNTTTTGIGCSITVDIIGVTTNFVGMSSSPEFKLSEVYIWKMTKFGYGFKKGDKFQVVGLSTDPDAGDLFLPFEVDVIDIFNDDIASWQFGQLDYIDNIKSLQDGARTRFPLYYQNQLISFEIDNNDPDSREIDLDPVLMIFVNGVLQEPVKHYTFGGGTSISFETAPTTEDDVFIFFYRGTVGSDSQLFDVNEIIKEGDSLDLFKSAQLELNQVAKDNTNFAQQDSRIVQRIATASVVETPFYQGSGVNNDNYKPLRWNKQKRDIVFGGGLVSKARDQSEAQITPIANVLSSIGSTDTSLFVDHTERFRDIDGLLTDDFGLFVHAPHVGFGTTAQPGINWEIWNDIDPLNTDVKGYAGLITGITTSAGIGTDLAIVFQLDTNDLINEFNSSYVQDFQQGYPFKVYASGITPAAGVITSIDSHDSDIIGISTYEVDNIYYATSLSWDGSARTGVITCNIHSGTNITGLVGVGSTAQPAARFTWGRFSSAIRDVGHPLTLNVKGLNYNPDLDEWPVAKRTNIGLRNTGALDKTL